MKKLILAAAVTIFFVACSEKPAPEKVETKPSVVYDLKQNGDTSILTVTDFESESVNFVFLDSAVTATGMTYDKLAEACQASMKEAKNWTLASHDVKYRGDSKVIVEDNKVFVVVEGEILSARPVEEAPTSFLIRANLDGTINPYRTFKPES